jgi:hypothetical protein
VHTFAPICLKQLKRAERAGKKRKAVQQQSLHSSCEAGRGIYVHPGGNMLHLHKLGKKAIGKPGKQLLYKNTLTICHWGGLAYLSVTNIICPSCNVVVKDPNLYFLASITDSQ